MFERFEFPDRHKRKRPIHRPFLSAVRMQPTEPPIPQSPVPWGFAGLCARLPSTAGLEGRRPITPCVFTPWKRFSKLIRLHYHVRASRNAVRGNRNYPPLPHLTGEKTTSRNLRSAAAERRGEHGSRLPSPCRAWPWLRPAPHSAQRGGSQGRDRCLRPGLSPALPSFRWWWQTPRLTRWTTPS